MLLIVSGVLFNFSFQYFNKTEKYKVTVAVSKTPLSTPFYVAKSIKAFDETCVSVEFDEVIGGQAAFAKVINGEVDFGTSSDSVIAFQSLVNKPFVTHAMFVQSHNDVKLLSRPADNVSSALDLKGKRIGVIKGTASEYFLSTLLAIEGLKLKDVELHYFTPEQLSDAFIDNLVDAIVPWEPYAFQSAELLGKQVKVHDTKNLNTLSFNLISLPADPILVEKSKCIISGLNSAINYIASYPNESKKIVVNALNLAPELIEWVWSDYVFKLALNQSLILSIKSQATWAIESQMSEYDRMPNIEQFIDSRAMLQVDAGAVNIPF